MSSRALRRVPPILAAATLVLATSACQDSADGDPAATDPATTSETSSPTGSVTVPEPTEAVEPADGVLIDVPGATMHGLKGYRTVADYGLVQGYGDDQSSIILAPNLTKATSLDGFAKDFTKGFRGEGVTKRLDNAVVGGSYNAWHMLDEKDPTMEVHIFGVMFLDGAWTIEISFYNNGKPEPLTETEREATMASMLATFAPHAES